MSRIGIAGGDFCSAHGDRRTGARPGPGRRVIGGFY